MTRKAPPTGSRAPVRVVVIDDDPFESAFLVDVLKAAGHNASSLPSVIGVTNHIIQEAVQVVVLDVVMPTISGDKLAALLRKNLALPNLGIVLVSSLPEEEITPLVAATGVDGFVSKANVRAELSRVVAAAATR